VRNTSVWQRVLGLARTVIEAVVFDEDDDGIVVSVRPRKGARRRCGRCGRRAPWFDRGEGRRRWRALDLGTVRVFLEADAPMDRHRGPVTDTHPSPAPKVPTARPATAATIS
jgi:transposase